MEDIMLSVNTHEVKTRLSELLAKIETEQETIIICRNGNPVAGLIPWQKIIDPLLQDNELKEVIFHEDPALPLDESEWPDNYR
jgi:antitoxin (DNA-binding transcriptional repressor) of toxin-antitoxin stability system